MSAARYLDRVLGLLGDRDPIETLRATPARLDAIVRETPPERLRRRPFEGKWTPLEILGHLVDHEVVLACRVRLVRFEREPLIHGYDQERWVAAQRHNDADPAAFGRHSHRGDESLDLMLRTHAGHDLAHLDQLRRYLDAAPTPPTPPTNPTS